MVKYESSLSNTYQVYFRRGPYWPGFCRSWTRGSCVRSPAANIKRLQTSENVIQIIWT